MTCPHVVSARLPIRTHGLCVRLFARLVVVVRLARLVVVVRRMVALALVVGATLELIAPFAQRDRGGGEGGGEGDGPEHEGTLVPVNTMEGIYVNDEGVDERV
jgi:hypothetical protein